MATMDVEARELTAVDLADRFGPIPLRRIVLDPPPGEATEEDLVDLHERTRRVYELVDGILLEKPVGLYESWLAGRILGKINQYLEEHRLGFAAGEAGMLKLVEGLVRAPDVSYIAWSKTPDRRVPKQPVPQLVPDLAVEVLGRANTKQEIDRKLDDYFEAGVQLVWIIDPKTRTARVYASREQPTTLTTTDSLDGGGVLPGLTLKLAELFADAES
ncbi:MAG: Uma2 family endonuclease [Planctomycetaceae bacterium]